MTNKNEERIGVSAVFVASQSTVRPVGRGAFFFGRGWTEGLQVLDLPAGVEYTLWGTTPATATSEGKRYDLGRSSQGKWTAGVDCRFRSTHTTLMALVLKQELRNVLINLSAFSSVELMFDTVLMTGEIKVRQVMYLTLESSTLQPLFPSHYPPLSKEQVIELSKRDQRSLPPVMVKRRYVYPPQFQVQTQTAQA
jgi:hypothetical protein